MDKQSMQQLSQQPNHLASFAQSADQELKLPKSSISQSTNTLNEPLNALNQSQLPQKVEKPRKQFSFNRPSEILFDILECQQESINQSLIELDCQPQVKQTGTKNDQPKYHKSFENDGVSNQKISSKQLQPGTEQLNIQNIQNLILKVKIQNYQVGVDEIGEKLTKMKALLANNPVSAQLQLLSSQMQEEISYLQSLKYHNP